MQIYGKDCIFAPEKEIKTKKMIVMANWCSSDYAFVGDKEQIETLYRTMQDLETMKEPLAKSDFGNTWLGCLVEVLGASREDVYCRGEWHSLELKDNVLTFATETAWEPAYEVIELICKKFPSIRYYYCAEETSIGVYETNDREGRFFPIEKYYFNARSSNGKSDSGYVDELQYALAGVNDVMGCDAESIEDVERINSDLSKQNTDAHCSILELRIV